LQIALIGFVSALFFAGLVVDAVAQSGARLGSDKPSFEKAIPDLPVATDAKLEATGDGVRLTMMLSRPVALASAVMAGPDRIVIDLPSVNFQAQQSGKGGVGFVSAYRFGLFTHDKARIVLDLAQPAIIAKAEMRPRRGGFGELVVELKRVPRAEFLAAAAEAAAKKQDQRSDRLAHTPLDAKPAGDPRQLVVIDPGHGGIDPGAVIAAISEKTVVLAFGQRLKESLESSGRYRVMMTRDDDTFVPLAERVKIARAAGADLFVSIHADSLTQAQDVRGATVYTASERATDAEAARLAAKENQADAVAGLDASEDIQDVAGILMDLAKRETRSFSAVFARNLVDRLGGSVKMHRIPLRSAGFRVLSAPDVPSVLIELGYMSSPKDAELLASVEWRGKAVAAVQEAIDAYFVQARGIAGKAVENRR